MDARFAFVSFAILAVLCFGCGAPVATPAAEKPKQSEPTAEKPNQSDLVASVPRTGQPKASADDGRLSWSALECSRYASLSGQPQETERLFRLGYDSGKRFFDAVLSKEISEEEARKHTPVGLLWLASGPTADFILGRIYEVRQQEAYDKVVKHDEDGGDLPVTKWRTDKELQKIIAGNEYRKQNCALLK